MLIKNNHSFRKIASGFFFSAILIFASTFETRMQVRSVNRSAPPAAAAAQGEDFTWWYVSLFVLALGLAGAIFWWLNAKKAQKNAASKNNRTAANQDELGSFDADAELEWLRKNQMLGGKTNSRSSKTKQRAGNSPNGDSAAGQNQSAPENAAAGENAADPARLPIFSIKRLELARPFDALPISNDEDLMNAIEQGYDEFEEDETVRELGVNVLAAFRTRNSIETLSQVALYDLSSNLRSRAVSVLADFDHESVFETILLANADPTREVRAAAARGLSKLSFDRADAWTRISETGEAGRMTTSARAAIESGFVDMSFDRLVHPDRKYAYEAFALMALLIKSGESEKIFGALETHPDINVQKAILHVIKITKDQKAIEGLCALLEKNTLPIELQEEIDKTVEEVGFVTV